jgi:hypothetical protein
MVLTTLDGLDRNVTMYLKQVHADPLIQMKKYADTYTGVGAGLDKNGLPVTGLTEDYTTVGSSGKTRIVKGTRKVLEQELDLAEGTLKNTNADYWAKYFVRVGSDPIAMDLRVGHDLLKYLFSLAQSIVADGVSKIGSDSRIEYVLYSQEQEAANRVKGRRNLKTAYNLAETLDLETKINILAVYGEVADATSPNAIIDKIDEKIEEDAKKFLQIAEDGNLVAKSLLSKALDKAIFTKKDGAVYHEDVVVGYTPDDAAAAIAKDKTLRAIIKAKLSGDMDLIREALAGKPEEVVKSK